MSRVHWDYRGRRWVIASAGVSECFGTIRYGRLAEVLLYDIRRTRHSGRPERVYVDLEAEKWLQARTVSH